MFIMAINDIVDCAVHALALLFADDIKMAMTVSSIDDTRCLQSDINNVLQWSERNKLPFNLVKCEVITVKRCNQFYNATYMMGSHTVERKEEVRDLGITVDLRFTFGAHIDRSRTKARQMMGYIKSIIKRTIRH